MKLRLRVGLALCWLGFHNASLSGRPYAEYTSGANYWYCCRCERRWK